ncbi:hypothetical protein [Palleronia sp.]|uniref:hypothetical protein n=1 Tax=Palleronia sp. TaxID=1940284 RepID=UPI0035C87BCE
MTDAMSSGEIDRVLANIRKLVSVEEAQPAASGRLVLTSDLRVQEPADGSAALQQAPEEAVHAEAVVETDAGWPDMALPEPAEDLPPAFEVVTERSARPKSLEERIADLQAAIGMDHSVEFEPDGSEDQAQHLPDRVPSVRPRGIAPQMARSDGPLRLVPVEDDAEDGRADIFEDAGVDRGAGASSPYDPSDLRFFPSPTQGRFERADYAGRDDPLELGDDEQFLDEDALRDLVAEIVREELAGALGERITRNVRKLVRREVMRALSARDFE